MSRTPALAAWFLGASAAAVMTAAAAASSDAPPLADLLRRVGEQIERRYERAQAVVSTESVSIQPLRADMMPADFPRRLIFELRVAWDPDSRGAGALPDATVLREVLSVNGRPARRDADPGCMDPKPVSPEPLRLLLPARLGESEFTFAGAGRFDGRAAWMVDYRGAAALPPEITWTDECVTVSLPGRSRGRIWLDAETHDVLRIDDRLVGRFEFDVPREHVRRGAARSMTIERAESSIRYRFVDFQDPPERLALPASVDTVTVIRGHGVQRVRITQRFSDHRRFVTDGRLVY